MLECYNLKIEKEVKASKISYSFTSTFFDVITQKARI